jgi:DUF2911 family protein
MLKRFAILAAGLLAAAPVFAQNARGEAKAAFAGKNVVIDYGRPSLKGRDMLGQAQVGQAWRLGADSPTTLKTDADLAFGTAAVPKGEYVLRATKVADNQWQLNVVGKDDAKVADVPLTGSKLDASVEQFTIDLLGDKDKGQLKLRWGTTALVTSFTAR